MGVLVAGAFTVVPAPGAAPGSGTITTSAPVVRWSGGPLIAGAGEGFCSVQPTACDEFSLTLEVPRSYWHRHPGGVVVRIDWSGMNSELDLVVFNPAGEQIADSNIGAREFQQVFLSQPEAGAYRIEVNGFAAEGVTYKGTAALTEQRTPRVPTTSNTMQFAHSLVDPQLYGLGPGIWADRDGRVFVSALQGAATLTGFLWRSDDEGRTFKPLDARLPGGASDPRHRPCAASAGGGDVDVVTDQTGRVYFADNEVANITTGYSIDHGDTWQCNQLAISKGPAPKGSIDTADVDRPWLAPAPTADGEKGPGIDAYLAYNDFVLGQLPGSTITPRRVHVAVTADGGKTWTETSSFGDGLVPFVGRLLVAKDGTVYVLFDSANGVWLARSADHGRTFKRLLVSQRLGRPGHPFVTGDVDSAGNVYAAWSDSGTYDVLYSDSKDKGEHWSIPLRVNPPESETAFYPWLAAGRTGDVAIGWYGTSGSFVPGLAPSGSKWFAWAARSLEGTSSSPAFQIARMSETPVRLGGCCGGFGDFMRVSIAPDGVLLAAYDDDAYVGGSIGGSIGRPFVIVARQVSGAGMSPLVARSAAAVAEPEGDASPPTQSSPGEDVPELDYTSTPSATLSGTVMRVSFSLSGATHLRQAFVATHSTDAYWIVIWKTNDRVEYAGMHVGESGVPNFFGGIQPVGVLDPTSGGDFGASYPATKPVEGTVAAASGRVTIDVPLTDFQMKIGERVHGLQAFSMTGLLDRRTAYTMLDVVDATSARSVQLGPITLPKPNPPQVLPSKDRMRTLPATGVDGSPLALPMLFGAGALSSLRRLKRGSGTRTR